MLECRSIALDMPRLRDETDWADRDASILLKLHLERNDSECLDSGPIA